MDPIETQIFNIQLSQSCRDDGVLSDKEYLETVRESIKNIKNLIEEKKES